MKYKINVQDQNIRCSSCGVKCNDEIEARNSKCNMCNEVENE